MIKKLLVANRGEIAVRVIRAARELGVRTVAVFSEADAGMPHVLLADEAVAIGAPEASKSYLVTEKIIGAARETGADAIHPGYGFLSERAEFSQACLDNNIIFVGPPPSAMRALGAKIDAKQLAVQNGVPVTPGYFEPGASADQLKRAADDIGYPVMLKASAGGGGRGMRIVNSSQDFFSELSIASDEALKGFGDGAMMVEKLILRPRHIEVQVLADQHGNVACLFERECSLQRRHQKLIEEAPSPVMSEALWNRMQDSVRKLIRAAGYTGAGTVEFMLDETTGEFYFLEVNARLQVEHPVTEAITGLDLVKWQLRVASGEELNIPEELLRGDRKAINGHAIEVRIVAEDPAMGFLPSAGKILAWAMPSQPGVRVDTGYGPNTEVPRYYDSLIAKVIVSAEDRVQAIDKMKQALLDCHILGVKTNIAYLLDILGHPDFAAGRFDTGFLGREFSDWKDDDPIPMEVGALMQAASVGQTSSAYASTSSQEGGPWAIADGFRNVP